jgi:PAS domain S-box-containing protein
MFGLTPDPSTFFQQYIDLLIPEDKQRVLNALDETINKNVPYNIDYQVVLHNGKKRFIHAEAITIYDNDRPVKILGTAQDITELKQEEYRIFRYNRVLEGINRIFSNVVQAKNEEELGNICLSVALELTGGGIGFVNLLGDDGLMHDIAINEGGWDQCLIYDKIGHRRPPGNFVVHGLYGHVITSGKSFFTNNPPLHSKSIGLPAAHPPLKSFLGVPLFLDGKIKGMIAVANREGGYSHEQLEDLEAIAPAVMQALHRKKSEEALREAYENLQAQSEELQAQSEEVQVQNEELQSQSVELHKAYETLNKSEEKYRNIVETANEGIWLTDAETKTTYVNKKIADLLGYTTEEMIGILALDLVDKEYRTYADQRMEKRRKGIDEVHENKLVRKDGSTLWAFINSKSLFDKDGKFIGVLAMLTDITERKKVEEALKKSEEKYRSLYEKMLDGLVIVGMDGFIQEYNNAYREMLGYSDAELRHLTYSDITPEKWHASEARIVKEEIVKKGYSGIYEKEYRRKDGTIIPIELRTHLIRDASGQPAGMWSIIRDITERKQLEEKIRQRAEELEMVMEVAPVAIWVGHDPQSHNITGNRTANEFYEAEVGENVSANITPIRRFFHKGRELTADELPMQESSSKDIDVRNVELDVLLPSGKWRTILGSASPLHAVDGNVRGSVGTFIDITERKQAEEELTAAHSQIQSIIDNTPDIVYAFDLEERFVLANKSVANVLNSTPDRMIGKRRHEFMPKDDADRHEANDRQVLEAGRVLEFEEYSHLEGRSITWLTKKFPLRDAQGMIYAVAGISTDITERKQAEEALRESEAYRKVTEAIEAERQRLFDMLETLPAMVCLLTPDHHYAFTNRTFRKKFGEPGTKHCYECCFGLTEPCEFCEAYQVLETGQPNYWEVTTPDSSVVDVYNFPFTDVDGSPMILEMDFDITERKKAEEKIRQLANIVESSNDAILTESLDGVITSWNKGAEQIYGCSAEEVLGKNISMFEPDDRIGETRQLLEAIKPFGSERMEQLLMFQ